MNSIDYSSMNHLDTIDRACRRFHFALTIFLLIAFSLIMVPANDARATTVTINTSGNWTAPAGVTSITVEAWGGGGAGGGATGNPAKGGGGAGGQYASKVVAVTPGNVYAVTVGAGGIGAQTAGPAGGDSTFATNVVVAKGGAGGALGSTNSGTAAGGAGSATGAVGTTVFAGGNGSDGVGSTGVGGAGGGGAGSGGVGGNASGNTAGTGTANGGGAGAAARTSGGDCTNAATASGGGGCGGYATSNTDRAGNDGAAGKVVITYSLPTVTTNAATSLSTTGATLNGSVSSNGATTTVTFDYGTTTAYGSTATAAQSPLASGASGTAVTAVLTGLTCGTTYHYRVNGTNSSGTANGSDLTFTTSSCPFVCAQPSNTPAGLSLTCVCDTFARATLNPSTIYGSNWIVSTSDTTGIVPSIVNSGYLRLTNNTGNNAKAATVPGIFPAAGNYISVEFQQFAYNGSGADGIAVTLSDYATSAVPGAFGGSLGYAQKTGASCNTASCPGFAGGWIGVALDEFGNYQNATEGRIGGPGSIPQSVGVRGSGSGVSGYNWLAGTSGLTPLIDNRTSTTPSLGYYYQVIVDARNDASGTTAVSVNRDTGSGYTSLISIPNVYTTAAAQGFTQSPVPNNWQISFTGSTGGSTNIHEISGLRICAQTVAPPSGGTAGGFNAIDEAYGTPPSVAVQNYLTGHIYMKLVGTPFKLNVAALNNSQILTTYAASAAKSVTLKLVDNSDGACVLDSTQPNYCSSTCTNKTAVTGGSQTLTFASGASDKGQKQSSSFTLNSAYSNLAAIISDGTTTACSTDAFSVRPTSITSVTSSNATNIGTSGTPTFKAGTDNFTLIATTAGISGSPSGYTGVLKINSTKVQPYTPATVTGTLSPSTFPAAVSGSGSSTATGATFTYSEVGAFKIAGYDPATDTTSPRGVYDGVASATECPAATVTAAQCDTLRAATWTGVDSITSKGDCVLDSYSNTKDANGKYGCNFGNTSIAPPNAVAFGRFVPDHFDTVITGGMACPTGLTCPSTFNGFVYSGQGFTTTVTARNGSGATTLNYDSGIGLSKNVTLGAWDSLGSTTTANPAGGTLTGNTIASTAFASGVATSTPVYALPNVSPSTSPTAPTDIYLRAVDTDGVTSLRGASSIEGGIKIVGGRILVPNAYGSELLKLPLTLMVQYWNGTRYVVSSTDTTTTSLAASTVVFTNCTKNLTGTPCKPIVAVDTPPASISLTGGVGSFKLKAPGADGSADLTISGPSYLPSTTGRVTFGVYKAGPVIYLREIY